MIQEKKRRKRKTPIDRAHVAKASLIVNIVDLWLYGDGVGRRPLHPRCGGGYPPSQPGSCINKGGEIDMEDKRRWTPLPWAAFADQKVVVRLLLDRGADMAGMGFGSSSKSEHE